MNYFETTSILRVYPATLLLVTNIYKPVCLLNAISDQVITIAALWSQKQRGRPCFCMGGLFYGISGRDWLGWQDSNLRMPVPKTGALPLGYTPAADFNMRRRAAHIARENMKAMCLVPFFS
jgi:hypothetical protein